MDTHSHSNHNEPANIKVLMLDLISNGQFPVTIQTSQACQQAQLLVELLEPNYGDFSAFIEILKKSVADWQAKPAPLRNFFDAMINHRGDEAVIRTVMKEWGLGLADIDALFDTYGLTGELLDGSRSLTRPQIEILQRKFGLPSFVFFEANPSSTLEEAPQNTEV